MIQSKPIKQIVNAKNYQDFRAKKNKFIFTDIDDTLTDEGQLGTEAYSALWKLHKNNFNVVPITGRPAGWCEMIARQWPVAGVVGENGAFYFRYHNKKMQRHFFIDEAERLHNQQKLKAIEVEVLNSVPGSAIASDQFCRLFDLAIDFCEDVPALNSTEVQKIVDIFLKHGAQAKISSIHVNGWFGNYNKMQMTLEFLKKEFAIGNQEAQSCAIFSGDSPNDEPMFQFFPLSVGVANVADFEDQLKYPPQFICSKRGGLGFAEMADLIINNQS